MDAVWIPVIIVLVAIVAYAAVHIFGSKKRDLTKDAEAEAENVRAAAEAALTVELKALDSEREELEGVKAIENDAERLKALADFANRRRKR